MLPARVIDVGDLNGPLEPFLHDYSSSDGPYVALSHCWDTLDIITTTKDNLLEHKDGIPWHRISKTFRDAVQITRNIEVRYLWIDSLCIIQDDHQDWDRESPKMGYIYKNSILNLAAASSQNGDGGCLPLRALEVAMSIPYDLDKASVACRIYVRDPLKDFQETVYGSPLNKRAWVQQEILLSRRTLYCAQDQMHWKCYEAAESEDGTNLASLDSRQHRSKSALSFDDLFSSSLTERDDESVYTKWYRVVRLYTSCKMTKATDKLPAISGLANLVAKRSGDQYLAGLWLKDLAFGLLWSPSRGDAPRLTRPPSWRAPSWSWAALDGRVKFGHHAFLSLRKTQQSCLDILEASVALSGVNPYDMVSSGHLLVAGRLVQLEYETLTESLDYFNSILPSMQDPLYDEGQECGYAMFDEAGLTGIIYGLEVFGNLGVLNPTVLIKTDVLLLKATAKVDVYCRVGIGSINGHLFDGNFKERITIV